ncbi:hypothetical protein TCON_2121, partial [Astathelohania contejeani]
PPIHLIDLYCFSTLYKNIIILGICSIVIVPIYIVIIVYICYYHCRCLRSSKANPSANIRTRAVSLENNTTNPTPPNSPHFPNNQMVTFRPLLPLPTPLPSPPPHLPPPLPPLSLFPQFPPPSSSHNTHRLYNNENDYETAPSINYLIMKRYSF